MKITLIPSSVAVAGEVVHQYTTSFVVNDCIAIDAGALGFWQSPTEQAAIRHVFLSHTHIDHLASLPIFLENVFDTHPTPVTLYASEVVQDCLRRDVFNGRIWPNFLDMAEHNKRFVELHTIQHGQTVEVEGLRITAITVNHVVPTLGFILEEASSALIVVSDTGPTEEIWRRAKQTPNLKAVFLEATFPDELGWLAELSKHLTPAGFAGEMDKLAGTATFFAVHLRARFREQVTHELMALHRPNLEVARFGTSYEF